MNALGIAWTSLGVTLAALALGAGWTANPFVLGAIALAYVIGTWAAASRRDSVTSWATETILLVGLLGTVAGLITAFSGINISGPITPETSGRILLTVFHGLGESLPATFAGVVSAVWLNTFARLQGAK